MKGSRVFRFLVLACVLYFTATLIGSHMEITQKEEELVRVEQQCEAQRIENKEIERQLLMFEDPEYLERAARDQLGFGYPDERVYIDTSGLK